MGAPPIDPPTTRALEKPFLRTMHIGGNLGGGFLSSKGGQGLIAPETAGKDLFSGRPSKLTNHLLELVGQMIILNNDKAD